MPVDGPIFRSELSKTKWCLVMQDPLDNHLVKVVGIFDMSEDAIEFQQEDRECEKDYNSFLCQIELTTNK